MISIHEIKLTPLLPGKKALMNELKDLLSEQLNTVIGVHC